MTHTITHVVAHHGYLAILLLMTLESACIPVPSEAVLLYGGALAAGAFAASGHHVDLVGVALVGTAGNLVGSLIAYAAGRYGGRALITRHQVSWLIRPHHLERAERFFADRGPLAVGVARVLPVIRSFISLPAGIAEMPLIPFVTYTVLGCLPWTFALTAVGYGIGRHWDRVAHDFTPISVVFAVLLVAGVLLWWRRNRGAPDGERGVREA